MSSWHDALQRLAPHIPLTPLTLQQGATLEAHGLTGEALEAYGEFVTSQPKPVDGLRRMASLLDRIGRHAEAVEKRAAAHRLELAPLLASEEDREAMLHFRLASEGEEPAPERMPGAYVAVHFDRYADMFDAHLTGALNYCGHREIRRAIDERLAPRAHSLHILDLGCGTGLVGETTKELAARLVGVDLSPGMLEKARAKAIYDELHVDDATAFLARSEPASYDMILASDSFSYVGELEPAFHAMARVLRPGGHALLTLEEGQGDSWELAATQRYVHAHAYLERITRAATLELVEARRLVLRTQQKRPVESLLWMMSRA